MENQESTEGTTPTRPVWTGDQAKDVENLNTYIAAVGQSKGASQRRIEAVQVDGDTLLEEGGGLWALFRGIGDGTPDNHELYNALEESVAQQFEGPDEDYIGE